MAIVNYRKITEISKALTSNETAQRQAMTARLEEHPGMILSYTLDVLRDPAGLTVWLPLSELKTVAKTVRDKNLPVVVTFAHQSVMANKSLYGILAKGGKNWTLPSTGINTFALATTFCDRVSLYGFHPTLLDKNSNRTVPYHYYDHGKIDNEMHKMSEEFVMFRDLHERGVVRHVTGKCNLE